MLGLSIDKPLILIHMAIKKLGFLRNFKREPEPSKIRQSRIGLGLLSDPSLLVNTQNDESLSFGCKDNDGRYGLISHSLITPCCSIGVSENQKNFMTLR